MRKLTPDQVAEYAKRKVMAEPWVVTYEICYRDRKRDLDCRSTDEFYRGSEAECYRIAKHSAPPTSYEGHKVTEFRVMVGRAANWDAFLKEMSETEV